MTDDTQEKTATIYSIHNDDADKMDASDEFIAVRIPLMPDDLTMVPVEVIKGKGVSFSVTPKRELTDRLYEWLSPRNLSCAIAYQIPKFDGDTPAITFWFPRECADQAMLFKLTFGGEL